MHSLVVFWQKALTVLACLWVGSGLWAQGPQLAQVEATFNFFHNYLDVRYDLTGDSAELRLAVSDDEGLTYLVPLDSLVGDTGLVAPGSGYHIRWVAPGPVNLVSTRIRLVALDLDPVDLGSLVAQVDSQRLLANLTWLATPRHPIAAPMGLAAIKDSLEARFSTHGLQTERQALQLFGGYRLENILGRQPGVLRERPTWVLDGHFDAVALTPGADDNASAVAALLECQRILAAYLPEETIRYIAFDQEEVGLLGSIHYVSTVGPPPYEDIQGVLNLEMIGYYDDQPNSQTLPLGFDLVFPAAAAAVAADGFRGNFLTVVGNGAASSLSQRLTQVAASYVPDLRIIALTVPGNGALVPDLRRSDHAPFWDAGLGALMLTDGADFRNPYYHTPADSIGTLNLTFMTRVTQAVLATLAQSAGLRQGDQVETSPTAISTGIATQPPVCGLSVEKLAGQMWVQRPPCLNGPVAVELFDLQGRVCWSASLAAHEPRLALPVISPGVYILREAHTQGSYQRKVLLR